MSKKNNSVEVICPLDYAFRRIGGKYKGRILWYLKSNEVMRYGELKRAVTDITTKMLTQTLRELEEDALISRKVYHELPPKVEYSLTDEGAEMLPFIDYLRHWGAKQMEKREMVDLKC
ncbi:helix-turn-helix domain-containing protein [Rapidithrix thailandica]|uniref:Helix-turn-helix domain-containing protein n=1 Tax=Rapidithrix thailandica TaxID=413964 RepID=A0AAW9SBY0_9BACT